MNSTAKKMAHEEIWQNSSNEDQGKLTRILRISGVFAILVSLYGFFVNGWDGGNDLMRFLMLLGHTVALAGIGLLSGHFLKEGKGARTLLMLALVSVTANFAILGSFIYAEFGQVPDGGYISSMRWQLGSTMDLLWLSIITPLLLLPVIMLGFRVLVRGMSRSMSLLFCFSNAVLLLPLRDPAWIAFFALILSAYTLFFNIRTTRKRSESRTLEGLVALLLQFLPIVLLLVRNIWLYADMAVLYAGAFVVAFIALRQLTLAMGNSSVFAGYTMLLSAICAMAGGGNLYQAMIEAQWNASFALMLSLWMMSGMFYELSLRSGSYANSLRTMAGGIMATILIFNMLLSGSIVAVVSVLASATLVMVASYRHKQRSLMLAGILMLSASVIKMTWHLWFMFDINGWVLSAVTGVIAIVAASILESKKSIFMHHLANWKSRYADWSN